jgi:hypothetical protein
MIPFRVGLPVGEFRLYRISNRDFPLWVIVDGAGARIGWLVQSAASYYEAWSDRFLIAAFETVEHAVLAAYHALAIKSLQCVEPCNYENCRCRRAMSWGAGGASPDCSRSEIAGRASRGEKPES